MASHEGEEFTIGTIVSRDGSDYSPSLPTPTWYDMQAFLSEEEVNTFELIVVGKGIYDATQSPTGIGGVSGIFDARDFANVAGASGGRISAAIRMAMRQPGNTAGYVGKLFDIPAPEHVTGVVIRILS